MNDDKHPHDGEDPDSILMFSEFIDLHWHVSRSEKDGEHLLYFGAKVRPDTTYHGIWLDFSTTPILQWDAAGIKTMADALAAKVAKDIQTFLQPRFVDAYEGIQKSRAKDIDREVEMFEVPDTIPDLPGGESETAP